MFMDCFKNTHNNISIVQKCHLKYIYHCFWRCCDRIRYKHRTAVYYFVKILQVRIFYSFIFYFYNYYIPLIDWLVYTNFVWSNRLFYCFITWWLHTKITPSYQEELQLKPRRIFAFERIILSWSNKILRSSD